MHTAFKEPMPTAPAKKGPEAKAKAPEAKAPEPVASAPTPPAIMVVAKPEKKSKKK